MIHLQPYIPCSCCGKKATWSYMPSEGGYYCDNCIPRGCSCMYHNAKMEMSDGTFLKDPPPTDPNDSWKWVKPYEIWTRLDEHGREYPCCEYSQLDDEDHMSQSIFDHAWEIYYKEHEEKRPNEFAMRVLRKF